MSHRKAIIKIIDKKIEQQHINIFYPQLKLKYRKLQYKINASILEIIKKLLKAEFSCTKEELSIHGEYRITLNKKNLLSLNIEIYSYATKGHSSFNTLHSLTIDTRNARLYNLKDLFIERSNYENIISSIIIKHIRDNGLPIIDEFANINEHRNFYLTEDAIVIYYKLNKNSPYAPIYCVPEFTIPFDTIKDIINPNGPINMLFYK